MSKNLFTEYQIKELEKNPNVLRVSDRTISYSSDFKVKAVMEYKSGKIPSQIFIENGFNLEVIGKNQPKRCLQRWRQTFEKFGELGLQSERRGKASSGRPSSKELSVEEKLKKAEARIKFLEAENDFLKKLEELERQALKKKRF
jgi:transposase